MTPNGSWVYLCMGQGLKSAPHTCSQFSDLVFGPLPATCDKSIPRQDTIIGIKEDFAFSIYMDDYVRATKSFDAIFKFLHTRYFPRFAFGPVYLAEKKTRIFNNHLQILSYEGGNRALRPSTKHRQQVLKWPIPINRAELDKFLWLTPFLRIFISGRVAHIMKLKEAYLIQVPAEIRPKKDHDGEVERCDGDLTKKPKTQ